MWPRKDPKLMRTEAGSTAFLCPLCSSGPAKTLGRDLLSPTLAELPQFCPVKFSGFLRNDVTMLGTSQSMPAECDVGLIALVAEQSMWHREVGAQLMMLHAWPSCRRAAAGACARNCFERRGILSLGCAPHCFPRVLW